MIAIGAVWGGLWAVAGLIWMTALTASLDHLITRTLATVDGDKFPAADGLSMTPAVARFSQWLLVIAALSGLVLWEKLAVFAGAGMFMGQVSNSNAHELIHRPGRGLRRAGRWVYISMLFGHHTSAHTLVHHVQVGAPEATPVQRAEGRVSIASSRGLGRVDFAPDCRQKISGSREQVARSGITPTSPMCSVRHWRWQLPRLLAVARAFLRRFACQALRKHS